jgi:hypothetical protein
VANDAVIGTDYFVLSAVAWLLCNVLANDGSGADVAANDDGGDDNNDDAVNVLVFLLFSCLSSAPFYDNY